MDYKQFEGPFRVGKRQNRVVLDAKGLEVVKFKVGNEQMATEYCNMLNLYPLSRCQELERENKRISDALGQISETIFCPTTLKEYEYFYLKATEMARAALKKG